MSDPRLTPDPARMHRRDTAQVGRPLADLCRTPGGARDRQVLFGETVTLFDTTDGWAYLQVAKDGYCGYVQTDALSPHQPATHWVSAQATHAYETADFKSPDVLNLSHGSQVTALAEKDRFVETQVGFLPDCHLRPLPARATDPAEIAAQFLGTPYLWGGNSCWGIDCSGLIQAALIACGQTCPGDSNMQMVLGKDATGSAYRRNDLLFWKGHVALVCDATTLIHANAASMSTRYEKIETALKRIQAQGDGPLIAHRRL